MSLLATDQPVFVPRKHLDLMLTFARTVFALKDHPAYLKALEPSLPPTAQHRPDWPSILMGFDFHLLPQGPRLIEINNNAGGLYIGDGRWLPQPDIPELADKLERRLVSMFPPLWQRIAIMDENVAQQHMYPEMCAYAELLRRDGRHVHVVNPEDIEARQDGLYVEAERLDAIYNRHTDFYLETPALAHIRQAYLAGQVSLNPHPRSYALIGDKRRMVDWWHPGLLESCVGSEEIRLIRSMTPETHLLIEMDSDEVWQTRKRWVFKPAARHGGKGVVLGRSMSRKRFHALDPSDTIVQEFVPPSLVEVNGRTMKFDVRLYMHGASLIAVAGRIWAGQLTNFREPGSGWVSLAID